MSPEGNENRINDSGRNKKEEDMDHNAPRAVRLLFKDDLHGHQ